MSWIYRKSEPGLWTVGFICSSTDEFEPASDHSTEQEAADRVHYLNGGNPEYAKLVAALRQCLNFIEHSQANIGKATTDEQWDANVEKYRKNSTDVGIGRCHVDKAYVDLAGVRKLLAHHANIDAPTACSSVHRLCK